MHSPGPAPHRRFRGLWGSGGDGVVIGATHLRKRRWKPMVKRAKRAAARSIVSVLFHFANPFGERFRSTRGAPGENGSHARRRPRPVLYCSGRLRGEVLLLPRLMLLVGVCGNFAGLTKKRGHRFFCPTLSCPSCHVDLHYVWTAPGSLRPRPGPSTKSPSTCGRQPSHYVRGRRPSREISRGPYCPSRSTSESPEPHHGARRGLSVSHCGLLWSVGGGDCGPGGTCKILS